MADQTGSSDWDRRTFGIGILGWAVPLLIASPLAWGHEAAGGEAVLWAGLVGSCLAVVGCLVSGAWIGAGAGRTGSATDAFGTGLAGVAVSGFAILGLSIAIDAIVKVVHLGVVPLLLLVPLVIGYCVGFWIGRLV